MDSRHIEADLYRNVSAEISNVFAGRMLVFQSSTKAIIKGDIQENATIRIMDDAEVKIESKAIHPTTKFILQDKAKLTFINNPPQVVINKMEKTSDTSVVYPKSQSSRLVYFVPGKVPGNPRSSTTNLSASSRKFPG